MSKIYVLRGRKIQKSVEDEAECPMLYTFAKAFADREAAIAAMKEQMEDVLPEIEEMIPEATVESLLEDGKVEGYSWRYCEFEENEDNSTVVEWMINSDDPMLLDEPILPYFVIEEMDVE